MDTSPGSPAVRLVGLTRSFASPAGPVTAVDGLDLEIGSGEVVALLGPNGAGKTTTLDLVLGLGSPTSGVVEVYGGSPRQAVLDGRVSAVLQTGGLLGDLRVGETVELVASTFSAGGGRHAPVEEVVRRAGITGLVDRLVSRCSGGEQQRLRFALALLPDPDLLVLDEPTAGMDVSARREFWATMRADAALGRTVVFATHYLEEADAFASRIVLVDRGRVVADGPTEVVRARATGRVVRADLPEGPAATLDAGLAALRGVPGVSEAVRDGRRVTVRSADSDAVAWHLLHDLRATGLEVTAGSLEDAFLALTTRETR